MNQDTFIMVKPAAHNMRKDLMSDLIRMVQPDGFMAVDVPAVNLDFVRRHYAEHKNKCFYNTLLSTFEGASVYLAVLSGEDIIESVMNACGPSNIPSECSKGTIRRDYGVDGPNNAIHRSDSVMSFDREFNIWMPYFDTSLI